MAIWNRKDIVKQKKEELISSFLANMEKDYNNLQDLKEDIKSIPGIDKFVGEDVLRKEVFKSMVLPVSSNEKLEDRYCMVSIIKCLLNADKEGKLTEYGLLPEDKEKITLCSPFVEYIEKSKFKNFLYKTQRGESFVDIINEKDIKPGAIVILTNIKKDTTEESGPQEDVLGATVDGRNHAMVFSSRDKETDRPMFSGFGNERNNVFIDRYTVGCIIDLPSCVENIFSRDENSKLQLELKLEHKKKETKKKFFMEQNVRRNTINK